MGHHSINCKINQYSCSSTIPPPDIHNYFWSTQIKCWFTQFVNLWSSESMRVVYVPLLESWTIALSGKIFHCSYEFRGRLAVPSAVPVFEFRSCPLEIFTITSDLLRWSVGSHILSRFVVLRKYEGCLLSPLESWKNDISEKIVHCHRTSGGSCSFPLPSFWKNFGRPPTSNVCLRITCRLLQCTLPLQSQPKIYV